MIDLPFDPDLVLFGTRLVAWHSVFAIVGMLLGVVLAIRLIRDRVPEDRGYAIGAWAVGAGFVGARLLHVLERWDTYLADPGRIFAVWDGGSSILGAVIGGFAAIAVVGWRMNVPVGYVLDAVAAVAGIGMAIGRIGDIINGEHHAVACAGLPWCVRYTNPNTLGQREYVHSAVAYELALDLAIAGMLLWLRPRVAGHQPEGRLMWLFLILYSFGRFWLSFLRLDPVVFAGLREAQLVSLGLVVLGVAASLFLARERQRRLAVEAV